MPEESLNSQQVAMYVCEYTFIEGLSKASFFRQEETKGYQPYHFPPESYFDRLVSRFASISVFPNLPDFATVGLIAKKQIDLALSDLPQPP
jgi:hypothetical protein